MKAKGCLPVAGLMLGSLVLSVSLRPSPLLSATAIFLGTPVRESPTYLLPILAAEDKGFWKELGLEVKWVPSRGGTELFTAVAAGSIHMGMNYISANILMASRGVPALMVARLGQVVRVSLWVGRDSRFKEAQDLKGARLGVTRLGSLTHAYSKAMLKALGMERDIRIVAAGGILASMAAIRSGTLDVIAQGENAIAKAEHDGLIRRLLDMTPHVPLDVQMTFATRQLIERDPDLVKRVIIGSLRAVGYVLQDTSWTRGKMEKEMGWPGPLAKEFAEVRFPRDWLFRPDGKMDLNELKAMQGFLVANGLVPRDRVPSLERLYSAKFVPVE